VQEVNEVDMNIYRKYLGPDYKEPKKYSIIISNHLSWIEIIHNLKIGAGFIAKEELENVPIVGLVIKCLEGLFIARENKDSRDKVLNDIKKRQEDFMLGDRDTPLIIYPEGTISSGTHIMPFKKGAFCSLLPVKPYLSIPIFGDSYDLSPSAISALDHMLISTCFLGCTYIFKNLPIIEFTEFAKTNNKKLETEEDYETYMRTCYNIMKEVGNFKQTDKGFKEATEYQKKVIEYSKNKKEK
jgi:lysophosphatidylcholine acyltransferase / lyso-PAF acetyltransferase